MSYSRLENLHSLASNMNDTGMLGKCSRASRCLSEAVFNKAPYDVLFLSHTLSQKSGTLFGL